MPIDINGQRKNYKELNKRLASYVINIHDIFADIEKQACLIASRTSYDADSEKPFSFNDYPNVKKSVESLKQRYINDIKTTIYAGTSNEWKRSNIIQDLIAYGYIKKYKATIDGKKTTVYYQENSDALKAFQSRKINKHGTLSQNLWKQSNEHLNSLETAIGTAIKKGTSAVTLSKQVSKYLQDFDKLRKDYKDTYGKKTDITDCEYRASKLARSEINMAYRTAEQTRWQQMDFVLGYEIQLSKAHPKVDECDLLAGRYPKDFVWTGWHPNDMCFSVPILMSEDDFIRKMNGEQVSSKPVTDVPQAFKNWIADKKDKIQQAKSIPYFVKDNNKYVS